MALAAFVHNPLFLRSAHVAAALEEPGHKVVERAIELAPIGATGDLSRSIEGHIVEDGTRIVFRVTAHDYKGGWTEFGTVKEVAEPFLGPAAHDIVGNLH